MHRVSAAFATLLAVVTAILVASSSPAFAIDVNGIPVTTAAGDQILPVAVSDGAGGIIVAWHDLSNGRCYAQRLNAAGVPQWTANGVALSTTASASEEVVMVADGAGGAFLAFEGSTVIPRAQRVNSAGVPQWGADGVALTDNPSATRHLAIALDVGGAGGVFVAWRLDNGAGGTSDVYAQKLNSAGALQWGSGVGVATTNMNGEGNPAILSDGTGGGYFAFIGGQGVRLRRLDNNGNDVFSQLNLAAMGNNMPPTMASDGANGVVIAWGGGGAFIQRVTSAGNRLWGAANAGFLLSSAGRAPTVIGDGANGAIVTWEDSRAPTNFNLYAQRIDFEGATQWMADGLPYCQSPGDQRAPKIISNGSGDGIITWYDARAEFFGIDIYAQRINGVTGASQWTSEGVLVCNAPNDQTVPTIVSDGNFGAWVAWQDRRSGTNEDIYAAHLAPNGSALDVPNAPSSELQARAWPDPFVDRVHLSFALPAAANVRVAVYGVDGREVANLGAATLPAGLHRMTWDGRARDGRPASAGLYFIRVQGPGVALTRSVVRLK